MFARLLLLSLSLTACSKPHEQAKTAPTLGDKVQPISVAPPYKKDFSQNNLPVETSPPLRPRAQVKWSVEPRPPEDSRICEAGNVIQCILNGHRAFRTQDWERAIEEFRATCTSPLIKTLSAISDRERHAIEVGCSRAVLIPWELKHDLPIQRSAINSALDSLSKSCKDGLNSSCSTVRFRENAPYLFSEQELAEYRENKEKILETSCKLQHTQDCVSLAIVLRADLADPKKLARSRDLLDAACSRGDQHACYLETAYYFKEELGFPVNYEKGHQLLNSSCDKGGHWSCNTLARLHRGGGGVPASEEKYYEYLIKACDLFDWSSCEKASEGPRELLEKLGAYIVESPAEDAGSQNHPTKNNPMPEER